MRYRIDDIFLYRTIKEVAMDLSDDEIYKIYERLHAKDTWRISDIEKMKDEVKR